MNPNKKIRHITTGKEFAKTYPSQDEKEGLPKKDIEMPNGKGGMTTIKVPDESHLPRETIGNVIMNCLGRYQPKDNKETVAINLAMQSLWDTEDRDEIEFKEKIKTFIIKVLHDQTSRIEKNEKNEEIEKGSYAAWVIAQVLEEMGVPQEF